MTKRIRVRLLSVAVVLSAAVAAGYAFWGTFPVPVVSAVLSVPPNPPPTVDYDPGASGLNPPLAFQSKVTGIKTSAEFTALVKRVAISRVIASKTKANYFDSLLTVFDSASPNAAMNYQFSAKQGVDPGYMGVVALNRKDNVIFEFGRYGSMGMFYFYNFNLRSRKFQLLGPDSVQNEDTTFSPDGRFLTYSQNGFVQVSDEPVIPFQLYIHQSDGLKHAEIYEGDYLYGSASWLPDNTLAYSHIEQKANAKIPMTFLYDPRLNKSRLWITNCASPRVSPDGNYVVFFGARDLSQDYTDTLHRKFSDSDQEKSNQALFIKSLKTGKVSRLRTQTIYDYEPKICWSSDSNSFLMAGENESSNLRMSLYKVGRTKPSWNSGIAISERGQLSNIYSFKGKFLVQTMQFTSFASPLDGETTQDYRLFLLNGASPGWREIFSAFNIKSLDLAG